VTLDPRASSVDNQYVQHRIKVRSEYQAVSAYVGTTKVASIVPPGFGFVPIKYEDRYVLYNPGSNEVSIAGDSAYFGPTVRHWPMEGVVVGAVAAETSPYEVYVFTFDVLNPPEGRYSTPCRAVPCRALPCRALPCLALPCLALPCCLPLPRLAPLASSPRLCTRLHVAGCN